MTKKIFLTSAIAMCIACPSFAEEFPQDGYMQENKTYDNAATDGNMDGVYEGSVNANAEYDDILYTISAGKYLPAGGESVVDCNVSGSFCPGLQSQVTYNANNPQGLSSCPDGYGVSDTGAKVNTDCYRICATTDINHSTTVTGNVYYNGTDGDGVKTCEVTSCEHGWHVKPANDTSNPDLVSLIGNTSITGYVTRNDRGIYDEVSTLPKSGLSNSSFKVAYGDKGTLSGLSVCSTQSGTLGTLQDGVYVGISTSDTKPASGGLHCWCNLESYTSSDGQAQSISSPWFYYKYIPNNVLGDCSYNCTMFCSYKFDPSGYEGYNYMRTVFEIISPSPATCAANTITINWSDADDANIGSKRSVTYGGDVVTPVKAVTKPGKTFKGWKFSKPTE